MDLLLVAQPAMNFCVLSVVLRWAALRTDPACVREICVLQIRRGGLANVNPRLSWQYIATTLGTI
jgi:hypothetical protein